MLAIDPDARVIVSSAYSNDPVLSNYEEYGFAAKLVKPFQIQNLQSSLAAILSPEVKKE